MISKDVVHPIETKNCLGGGFCNPFEKYAQVKMDHFPKDRGEIFLQKTLKTTTELLNAKLSLFPNCETIHDIYQPRNARNFKKNT